MRRIFFIWLALLLGLGPSMAAMPSDVFAAGLSKAESRLPACCRKHGAHHCAASMAMQAAGAGLAISAPGHCPDWPATLASVNGQVAAVIQAQAASLPLHLARHDAIWNRFQQQRCERREQPKRGPPSFLHA